MRPGVTESLAVDALLLSIESSGRWPGGVSGPLLVGAANLAELLLAGRIAVVDGRVVDVASAPLPGPAGALLLRIRYDARPRSLRRWLLRSSRLSFDAAQRQAVFEERLLVTGRLLQRRRLLDVRTRQDVVDRWRDLLAGRSVTADQATLSLLASDAGYGFRVAAGRAAREVAPATRLATEHLDPALLMLSAEVRRAVVRRRAVLLSILVMQVPIQLLRQLL